MKRGKYEILSRTVMEYPQGDDAMYPSVPVTYWWWRYVAGNGEIVCVSQQLQSEAAARKGIASVKRGAFNRVVVVKA